MGPKIKFLTLRLAAIAGIVFFAFLFCPSALDSVTFEEMPSSKEKALKIIKEIYREVKQLGRYAGEEFIKREFFVGEDDDDTNKDIHVIILIQEISAKERMVIEVTYMERTRTNPIIRIAKSSRIIICVIEGEKIEFIKNDYDIIEMNSFLPEILRAVQNKKRILKGESLNLEPEAI